MSFDKFHDEEISLTLATGIEFSFPVIFSHGVFAPGRDIFRRLLPNRGAGVGIFIERALTAPYPQLPAAAQRSLEEQGFDVRGEVVLLPGAEAAKNGFAVVEPALAEMAKRRLCRHSYVIAVGGGAFLDALGLAAALAHRGLRLVRVPTTALAQGDSGVGVKNGVNLFGQKNFAGTFAPPYAVINDLDFLATLGVPMLLDGIAEAFKVALIKDAKFFTFLADNATRIAAGDLSVIEKAIVRSAQLHARHIAEGGDPFELGGARPLDFGHWAAHKLEGMSDYRLRHGQAVAVGLALDLCYARSKGHISMAEQDQALEALRTCGLCLWDDLLLRTDARGEPEVFAGIREFREHLGGELAITLPSGIGSRLEIPQIDLPLMRECIRQLRDMHLEEEKQ